MTERIHFPWYSDLMTRQIHFVSGFPRSGSTLLCNILAQNPETFVTPTSACFDTLMIVRENWDKLVFHQADRKASAPHNMQRVLSGMLQSYHDTDRPVVLDKSRGWMGKLEMLNAIQGTPPKVIVTCRDIPQIVASFEKLYRKETHFRDSMGAYGKQQTVENRADLLVQAGGVVGSFFNTFKDALHRGLEDWLHVVEFSDLTHDPKGTMRKVYEFLELTPFEHDFENVKQETEEDDFVHRGELHTIRPVVKPVKDESVKLLGADLVKQLTGTEFWRK